MPVLAPYDRDDLRRQFQTAQPFPWIAIDNFLEPGFADEVARSYPPFNTAAEMGHQFKAVNENLKVQVCDSKLFPSPVKLLADTLSGREFLEDVAYITGMPNLLWDPSFGG